jgi:mono/diheme cytochrome c family protein
LPESLLTRRLLPALCVVASALAVGCEPPERESDQWPIAYDLLVEKAQAATLGEQGLRVYRKTCIACHGVDGKGGDQKTGADFTRSDGVLTRPDADLFQVVREGKKGQIGVMPAHKALITEAETTAVLAYVRETFGKGINPAPLGSAMPSPSASVATVSAPPVPSGKP